MGLFKGIDFAALSLMDALDLAILIEDEAKERYDDLAAQMEQHHTPGAAHFFRFMSVNEAKHGSDLAARRKELFQDEPARVTPAMIFDIEAPEFDEVRAFMSPREGLQVAFRAEKKAYAFFSAALPQVQEPSVRELFSELRDEEVYHQQLVLAEMERTPPESHLRASDVEDEPVAQ